MHSKGANGWQPEKWSYLKRSRTVINEIIVLGTLIHVHALGGDLSSPFDLCVSAYSMCTCVQMHVPVCLQVTKPFHSFFPFPFFNHFLLEPTAKVLLFFLTCFQPGTPAGDMDQKKRRSEK